MVATQQIVDEFQRELIEAPCCGKIPERVVSIKS
jgi:hypothetical protein